jgi:hypothetical protein
MIQDIDQSEIMILIDKQIVWGDKIWNPLDFSLKSNRIKSKVLLNWVV